MEELRAHATDWTQNIQNMSMDFRIPNPLEFNDPFLLQRRRWKRSERRRIRRGAQVTLGQWAQGGSANGHLPNRWAGLSGSASQLEVLPSLERAKARSRADAPPGLKAEGRLFPQLLARSLSLPVPRHANKPDPAFRGGSFSGSERSSESGSDSSASVCFQPCQTLRGLEEGLPRHDLEARPPPPAPHRSSLTPSCRPILLPSPPLNSASSASCQLLDFFGENLAYIDESSDALSDRHRPAAAGEDRRRRPRKPRRRSMRREPLHKRSPPWAEMQPPSNPPPPPPPPPDSSISDQNLTEPEDRRSN